MTEAEPRAIADSVTRAGGSAPPAGPPGSDRAGRAPRPWVRPPRLRTARGDDERHASWLELFFDLVFVVAVAQLAHELVLDHSPAGFARFAALFVPVYVAWQGLSAYADRFDTDDVLFRACMLAAMLVIAALSVQIPDVVHGRSAGFAVAYVLLRALTILLNLRAYRHVSVARPLTRFYASGYAVGVACWTASLAFPEPWRFVLWGVGLAVDLSLPWLNVRNMAQTPISAGHVAERFGLFTIIVLGESIVAVALGTAESAWRPASATAAAVGFLIAACLWWVYFDAGTGSPPRPGFRGVGFAYAHLPLLGALVAVGAGVDLLIEEADAGHLSTGGRWALGGGAAIYLLALTLARLQTLRGVLPSVAGVRLVAAALLAALAVAGADLRPVTFAGILLALLVALVVFEIDRNLGQPAETAPATSIGGGEEP